MKPPIKVTASTDNRSLVSLRFEGADGEPRVVGVPSAGNAYQAAHAFAPLLEATVNEILEANGVTPPPPAAPAEEPADKEPPKEPLPAA